MTFAFDTLGYTKALEAAGVERAQAEAHASAAREFIMAELVTKSDVMVLRSDIDALEKRLQQDLEALTMRLTIRLGGLLIAGIGALALLLRLPV